MPGPGGGNPSNRHCGPTNPRRLRNTATRPHPRLLGEMSRPPVARARAEPRPGRISPLGPAMTRPSRSRSIARATPTRPPPRRRATPRPDPTPLPRRGRGIERSPRPPRSGRGRPTMRLATPGTRPARPACPARRTRRLGQPLRPARIVQQRQGLPAPSDQFAEVHEPRLRPLAGGHQARPGGLLDRDLRPRRQAGVSLPVLIPLQQGLEQARRLVLDVVQLARPGMLPAEDLDRPMELGRMVAEDRAGRPSGPRRPPGTRPPSAWSRRPSGPGRSTPCPDGAAARRS